MFDLTIVPRRRPIFVAAILAGSFLLFLVQPMVARMALPRLGGAPAVWNSAMLVYQALLLGGYGYAHALGRIAPRRQAAVHLGVLLVACLWLPIGLRAIQLPADAEPALWVPWLLTASIGPLFFAVSAQAPLLQRWFSLASAGQDPYALYAASNLGSFAGLAAYPLLVEPGLAMHEQRLAWSLGYVAVIALVAGCAWALPRGAEGEIATPASAPPGRGRIGRWVLLASVPSGLMLATSTFISTDIVAMPLLWVLPLGLYLLSFSVAFAANRDTADLLTRIAPITILLFGGVMVAGYAEKPYLTAGMALVLLFMASVSVHTALYRLRPTADRLTGFYLAMSVGGALGGVFAALIAPAVFDWTYEYPILILAAGLLAPQDFLAGPIRRLWNGSPRSKTLVMLAVSALMLVLILTCTEKPEDVVSNPMQGFAFLVVAALGFAVIGRRAAYAIVLVGALILFGGYRSVALSLQGARTRSYFGVYTVGGDNRERQLTHGTTVHGVQLRGSGVRERMPTTYYVPGSGVGQAMLALEPLYGPAARVGVVGLGTGTLACYARPQQHWRFFEIDPAMVAIARDSKKFSFLALCLPHADVVIGDARLRLSEEASMRFDLLVLDAFSSDAVPMHLMTREAFATYARVLQPRGLLLVHISNRFLDLTPVVAAAVQDGGWTAARLLYLPPAGPRNGATPSAWIALSRAPAVIATLARRDSTWHPLPINPGFTPWTDDYSTILPLLKGGH